MRAEWDDPVGSKLMAALVALHNPQYASDADSSNGDDRG